MTINIDEVKRCKQYLNNINRYELAALTFTDDAGNFIKPTQEQIEEWRFTGLDNVDFIMSLDRAKKMRPLYIFDLDGTLALIDHRRPILDDLSNPNRWDDFYRACVDDKPNKPIIAIAEKLFYCGADIKIFSGRSNLVYKETTEWIFLHLYCMRELGDFFDQNSILAKMRPHGSSTPDQVLKRQWYEELSQQDKDRLVCVFDDRQKVVDMWRSIGVTCLQFAPGDF